MKRNTTQIVIICLLFLLGTLLTGCGNRGESAKFPAKPIRILVPFAAGGSVDFVARTIAEGAGRNMQKGTIVVENKPGAGGVIAMSELLSAKPDGYSLICSSSGVVTLQPHFGNTNFTATDPDPILRVVSYPNVMVVRSDAPWKTFDEWLDYVKANPGRFAYGMAGKGSASHVAGEAVAAAAGVKMAAVPFDGTAPALAALLGGHVQGAVILEPEAIAYTNAGTMRPLFSMGKSSVYPEAVVLKDKGINVEATAWTGIFAPQGMPDDIRGILHDAFKKALEDPKVLAAFKKRGYLPAYAGSGEFRQIIERDFNDNGAVLKAAGLIK